MRFTSKFIGRAASTDDEMPRTDHFDLEETGCLSDYQPSHSVVMVYIADS